MRVYQRKTLLAPAADFMEFAVLYGAAVKAKSTEALLLVREDKTRLMIVTIDNRVLLCEARSLGECVVSHDSTCSGGRHSFLGLSRKCAAPSECFLEPAGAISAIKSFFAGQDLAWALTCFRRGMPDPEILSFPEPLPAQTFHEPVKQVDRELLVEVPTKLRTDMRAVCAHLDKTVRGDLDRMDFDDAIQIGGLCGGLSDRAREVFLFSYHPGGGEVWSFTLPRAGLDAIAEGSLTRLKVCARIPVGSTRGPRGAV
jgi:hypothetical protein